MAMYRTLKYMLANILLTRITTTQSMLFTGSTNKSRTMGIICILDQWFSSPKPFNHLEINKTTAEDMGGGKIAYQRQNFSAI
jgi:hypothetical protein